MYAEHQILIEQYAKQNDKHMLRTLTFVMATANRKFAMVPRVLETGRGFSPMQERALAYLQEHSKLVYRAILDREDNEVELLRYLVGLPGFGMVKAGFVAQCVTGQIGCIDVHNAALYGVKRSVLTVDTTKATWKTVTEKLTKYIATCASIGGSEVLWDKWCAHLAKQYYDQPSKRIWYPWITAEAVSAFHVTTCCR